MSEDDLQEWAAAHEAKSRALNNDYMSSDPDPYSKVVQDRTQDLAMAIDSGDSEEISLAIEMFKRTKRRPVPQKAIGQTDHYDDIMSYGL